MSYRELVNGGRINWKFRPVAFGGKINRFCNDYSLTIPTSVSLSFIFCHYQTFFQVTFFFIALQHLLLTLKRLLILPVMLLAIIENLIMILSCDINHPNGYFMSLIMEG